MADVFISYKAEDRRRIQPLVQALQGDGLSVWWDEHIGAGDAWRETIERQLGEARCVIVIWSKRSVGPEGGFVREEASRAQRRGIYVPVLIDAVDPPLGFGESQATSLRGWHGNPDDAHYQALLAAIRRNVGGGKRRSRTSSPLPKANIDRRTVIAGGTVAAVAVASVGGWALLRSSRASASDSIAVLPFANLSGDSSQAYFSDGIAEELRSALARIAGLKVVGRTSSEAVRNDDTQSAAKKLGVANILTGSVRRSDTMIRISAQLLNGGNGLERWSQDYDRSPGDALKIESDIAENVARALAVTLGRASQQEIAVGSTQNPAAHDLYLKGRELVRSDESEDGMRRATGLFDSAIALDPKFADAYAQKAIALIKLTGFYGSSSAFTSGSAQAASIARQAIALAPDVVSGHTALALVLSQQLNMGAALPEYRRAYALAPGDVDNLLLYSRFLAFLGHQQTGLKLARQAERQDPLNSSVYTNEGSILRTSGRYAEAAAAFRKALQIAPKRLVSRALLSVTLLQAGRLNEATAEIEKLPSDYQFRLVNEAMRSCLQGNRAGFDAALSRAQHLYGDALSFQYAETYAQCGDRERAIAWLNKAWSIRDPGLLSIQADRLLDPVRSDPRFAALLQKMNFPSA